MQVSGIGKVSEQLLFSLGIKTCGDLITHRAKVVLLFSNVSSLFFSQSWDLDVRLIMFAKMAFAKVLAPKGMLSVAKPERGVLYPMIGFTIPLDTGDVIFHPQTKKSDVASSCPFFSGLYVCMCLNFMFEH